MQRYRCYGFRSSFSQSWQLYWKNILYRPVLRNVNPHGETTSAARKGSLLKDKNIMLASAAPLSVRALSNPAVNCTTATTAGAAPCHNHNLPAWFSSQVSSFSHLSPSLATKTALFRSHFSWCIPQGQFFPFCEETVPEVEAMGGLRWRDAVPLAVPIGWAWTCPTTHGGECPKLRLEIPSLAWGHLQQDGSRPWARPQPLGGRPMLA